MPPIRKNTRRQRRVQNTRGRRPFHGGKTFASSTPVKLAILDEKNNPVPINCEICANNNYTETIGTLNKSKVRAGFGSMFLGEAAEFLDTTSIIIYFCNFCGHARIIRNNSAIKINAYIASPDEVLKPIPANTPPPSPEQPTIPENPHEQPPPPPM